MCHMSGLQCPMSYVTANFQTRRTTEQKLWEKVFTKWWSLTLEGLLSTGPTRQVYEGHSCDFVLREREDRASSSAWMGKLVVPLNRHPWKSDNQSSFHWLGSLGRISHRVPIAAVWLKNIFLILAGKDTLKITKKTFQKQIVIVPCVSVSAKHPLLGVLETSNGRASS